MPVTVDQPAPYAPASAILDLIERHRSRGLPPTVDADALSRAGISDSLVPRTLQAMKTLDLLTDEGKPSPVFEGLRLAPSGEFQMRLAEWLTAAYADALSFVDPAQDDEVAIRDAFRKYIPTGQQGRMVTLFMGLFTAAGVMPSRQKQPSGAKPKPMRMIKVITSTTRSQVNPPPRRREQVQMGPSALPAALSGLLATLPPEGGRWTQERRDKFYTTFGAVLDYTYTIGEPLTDQEETATSQ